MAMVIIGRELAVTGLRGVALSWASSCPPSGLGKIKTVSQYVAITFLILDRGVRATSCPPPRVWGALWIALASPSSRARNLLYASSLKAGPRYAHQGPGTLP